MIGNDCQKSMQKTTFSFVLSLLNSKFIQRKELRLHQRYSLFRNTNANEILTKLASINSKKNLNCN